MNRGLWVGAIAFVIAVAAERAIAGMAADIARYDRMRKMSGEEPLAKELLGLLGSAIGKSGPGGFVADLTNDIVRYGRIRGM